MKKLFLFLTLCLALFMVACQQQNNAPQTDNKLGNLVEADISDKQDYSEEDISDTGVDNDDTKSSKLYYGTWNVTSCICVGPVSALSPEETKQLEGTVITYEEDRFVWNGEVCDAPAYQENTETGEDFGLSYNNRLTFTDLGLIGSEATAVVTIDNCDAFGNYFYVKDENTLVISYNGAFFEASRNRKGNKSSPTETKEKAHLYYGTWNVTSCICVGPVSALSPEETKQLEGTVITYEEDRFVWNGEVCDAAVYQENTETGEDFGLSYNNRLTFTDLGLTGSEATAVTVDNWDGFGNYFYVRDENTLVISYNGAFFEASRNLNGNKLSSTGTREIADLP